MSYDKVLDLQVWASATPNITRNGLPRICYADSRNDRERGRHDKEKGRIDTPSRHCEEQSDEAIHKRKAGYNKRKE